MSQNWVERLARRWTISGSTVRAWARAGHFGAMYRSRHLTISVGSQAVFEFETKYADALGVGAPSLVSHQLCKRYGIAKRTLAYWRTRFQFPRPMHIPGTLVKRWRVADIERWESAWKITPNTTIAT